MEDIKIRIGKKISYFRKKKGISQEELAFLSNLDRTYISSVENGKRNISIVNIHCICEALQIKLAELFKDL